MRQGDTWNNHDLGPLQPSNVRSTARSSSRAFFGGAQRTLTVRGVMQVQSLSDRGGRRPCAANLYRCTWPLSSEYRSPAAHSRPHSLDVAQSMSPRELGERAAIPNRSLMRGALRWKMHADDRACRLLLQRVTMGYCEDPLQRSSHASAPTRDPCSLVVREAQCGER